MITKLLAIGIVAVAFVFNTSADTTKGYTKKNGTYVAPSHKTSPDKSKANNYSTKGNVNPYTGKKGTVDPNKKTK
jgi:hypothetical protein